jgi:hypothetical protein
MKDTSLLRIPAVIIFVILMLYPNAAAQSDEKNSASLKGYVSYMNTVQFEEFDSYWLINNLVHNRLNFKYRLGESFTFTAEMRNRLMFGDYARTIPGYADDVGSDNGYLDFLTFTVADNASMILVSTFDRMNIEYNRGKFAITAGRQRINWGQSFVWNPNDIFNAYSYFDFDYEERQGSDALRVRYFTNETSEFDAAIKIDGENRITAALKYRFNRWDYDFQVLGGALEETDLVLGAGWSGNLGRTGFTGEISYFHPQENFADTSGVFLFGTGLNYLFKNSLSVSAEVMYNGYFSTLGIDSFSDLYFMPLSVKTISFSKFSWFGQVSYPIHPLLTGSFAVMLFPSIEGGNFLMPSLTWSVSNSMEATFLAQRFSGSFEDESQTANFFYLRIRYSF